MCQFLRALFITSFLDRNVHSLFQNPNMGFLRWGENQCRLFTVFVIASTILLVNFTQGNPTPGFIGHQFPYYLHYPVVPFNNHLAPHFNSIHPPIVARLAHPHPQPFFPPQWFQNPQFAQNQTIPNPSPNPTGESRSQPGQHGGGIGGTSTKAQSQFQDPQIADIRAKLVQQYEQRNQNQSTQSQRSNNGNNAKTEVGTQMVPVPLNRNVNNVNSITPNNFNNFGQAFQQKFGNFGTDQLQRQVAQQQGQPPITPQFNANLPTQNFPWQNFGWGWDNGWNVPLPPSQVIPVPDPQPPPTSSGDPPAIAMSTSNAGEPAPVAAPLTMEDPAATKEKNLTFLRSRSNNPELNRDNTKTMGSGYAPGSNSTEILTEKNPLIDAVAKFRRIVSQIRDITRNELRSKRDFTRKSY